MTENGKDSLPKWLSYDSGKNILQGVPSWRDKGTYSLQVKRSDVHTFEVTVKDFNEASLGNFNETKVPLVSWPHCPNRLPVAAATIIFDVNIANLNGDKRITLLQKVSAFVDVELEKLHMALGKGHNTAFGLKDIMILTAGPGDVADAKEPGVAVSWQIGCGIDIAGKLRITCTVLLKRNESDFCKVSFIVFQKDFKKIR